MNKRTPESISEEIRDLENVIISAKSMLDKYPDDFALQISLDQSQSRKKLLLSELDASLAEHRKHAIKYIIKNNGESVDLDVLINGLSSFKNLLNKTFEVVCSKPIELRFDAVFSSSFGILLSTPIDQSLLQGDYESGFKTVFETINEIGRDNADIHSIVNKKLRGNKRLVKRFSVFFDTIASADKTVEIKWTDHYRTETNVKIDTERASYLYHVFKDHGKVEPEFIDVVGSIKGMSLISGKIEFQRTDGKKKIVYKALFNDEMLSTIKELFNKPSRAVFKIEKEINEITEDEIRRYELVSISPANQ